MGAAPPSRFMIPETSSMEMAWLLNPKLSGCRPNAVAEAKRSAAQILARPSLAKSASESQVSAVAPSRVQSIVAPSMVSQSYSQSYADLTDFSQARSWPGVPEDLANKSREQDARMQEAMAECQRYLCRGDRGRLYHHPVGSTDATAFQNAVTKATQGVPLHKWDPRK